MNALDAIRKYEWLQREAEKLRSAAIHADLCLDAVLAKARLERPHNEDEGLAVLLYAMYGVVLIVMCVIPVLAFAGVPIAQHLVRAAFAWAWGR